jgi:uncharacterized protein DUF6412
MIRIALTIAVAQIAVGWQVAQHVATPSGAVALATVVLAAALLAVLSRAPYLGAALSAGPLRAAALRRKSWGAVFQRQRDPDAPGRARPRAPSAAPAAA